MKFYFTLLALSCFSSVFSQTMEPIDKRQPRKPKLYLKIFLVSQKNKPCLATSMLQNMAMAGLARKIVLM